ncbi:Uncharacterised protein [Streptococcus pneumoniae]|uniref:hypothetical protein n=1 Tax=Streptococcus TaxID=1301 RepID=UPI00076694DD|nr:MULTISPECIES: hypothetical protein [Streptococcus]CWE95399.1 Uncharacterised protein [Streptococcus pneumoniae]
MDFIITFLNSQFISSMIGALLGAGVAVYVAKLQNKQQLKQLQDEHKLQREFFEKQEENERERIFLQYTIERAERSYEILSDLRIAKNLFADAIFEFVKMISKEVESDEDIEFEKIFPLLYSDYLLPKYNSIIKLRDLLLLTLVIQDDIELSRLKEEVRKEVAIFVDYHKKINRVKNFEDYKKVAEDFMKKSQLTEKCDELRTYLTKYITETTFRLVSPEKMAEKILKQKYEESDLKFKVIRDDDKG